MSGDDEDRLDFGEDEELEDQISLGDADEVAAWQGSQQQDMQVDADTLKERPDSDAGQAITSASQAGTEASSSEEPLPEGWVTRVSRQGEMYYFHEATLTSQWDRPTTPVNATPHAVESTASEATSAQPVQQSAAASKSQDIPQQNETSDAPREVVASSKWGRQSQPLQAQAFTSRTAVLVDKPKSAREVAEAAAARQSASSSGTSRLPVVSDKAERDSSGRASPAIPTGPRSAREPPSGPRSQQQDSARWSSREAQNTQPRAQASLPTGPSADRNRRRELPPPMDRPPARESSSSAHIVRNSNAAHRGDAGWPVREPVGPPADLTRASSAGFREAPASRDRRDREYDNDRRPARNDLVPQERDIGSGYRSASSAGRDSRAPLRENGDQGWSRRPPPADVSSRRREPSPPRRPRSPPPLRRDPAPAAERRRRSPSPTPRGARDYPGPPSRALPARPPPRDDSANADRNVRRVRRSPSPPPMRKWAVRALTPPTAADEAQVPSISTEQKAEASLPATGKPDSQSGAQAEVTRNKQATTPTPSGVESGQLNKKAGTEEESKQAQRVDSESIARQPAENRSKPDDKAEKRSEVTNGPPPIKREKRPESPGLASRLDRPLSQPAPREPRPRRGRTPPAMQSSRRSPSPDAQRKRPASQHGPSLAERMGGGQRGETSLLSRMGENGKADNNRRRDPPSDGRPPKRSKKDDVKDSGRDSADMQIDSDQLASRVQAPRSRSQSPPANSRGIAILGASRNRPSAPSGGSESTKPAATNTPKEEESAQQRVLPQGTSSLIGSEVTEGKSDDANTKDTSTVSSNGLPPRPAGFASLPPKPPVVVPPPSFTTRGPPRGGSSTPNPALLDSYRPGPPPRRPSSRGLPAQESYQPGPPKDAPFIDRYVPRREPPPTRGPRRSPPPSRGPPRRDYR